MRKFRIFASLLFLWVFPWAVSGLRADRKDFIHPEIPKQDVNKIWSLNVVPYVISPTFGENDVQFIKKAMDDLTEKTSNCVRFVERTSENDYVKFIRESGQGGEQNISLTTGCLEKLGDIQHELMHALGFYNEISRADRDEYITINWENIESGRERLFQKINGSTDGLPYDYDSIMQFSFFAFAKDPDMPTILPMKKVRIGQRKGLSGLDIQHIQIRYRCNRP